MPIVTTKNVDVIYAGQEYTVDDFVEVLNSYGEELGSIEWAKGAGDMGS